jgi:hypothetical protein
MVLRPGDRVVVESESTERAPRAAAELVQGGDDKQSGRPGTSTPARARK